MSKTGVPILGSSFLKRLLAGNLALRNLERKVPEILPARSFRAELEMEMLCSDRTATVLTLLLLGVEHAHAEGAPVDLEHLARIVCECTRKTDRKGWFRDARGIRIGLILMQTPPERTHRIVEQIRQRYAESLMLGDHTGKGGEVVSEIYSYPPYRAGEGPGGEDGRGGPPEDEGTPRRKTGGAAPERAAKKERARPPIMELLIEPLPLWKRALDVTAASAALVVLSPLLAVIAAAIKLTSPGPVIFKQERLGYRGRIFRCWKFRSMRAGADIEVHKNYLSSLITQSSQAQAEDEEAPMIKLDAQDPQITRVGRLLRVSCLDELPQLVNVVLGEMSLVGPRPCLPYEADNYQRWHYRRLDAVPGITGLWQVKGKNKVSFKRMIRLDILYSRQRSLWLDLKILLMTFPAVWREIRDGMPAK